MMFVKFKANTMHVEVEDNKVILEAAVQTRCGKVIEYVDVILPISFKDRFTDLVEKQNEKKNSMSDLELIYLKRAQYKN